MAPSEAGGPTVKPGVRVLPEERQTVPPDGKYALARAEASGTKGEGGYRDRLQESPRRENRIDLGPFLIRLAEVHSLLKEDRPKAREQAWDAFCESFHELKKQLDLEFAALRIQAESVRCREDEVRIEFPTKIWIGYWEDLAFFSISVGRNDFRPMAEHIETE